MVDKAYETLLKVVIAILNQSARTYYRILFLDYIFANLGKGIDLKQIHIRETL